MNRILIMESTGLSVNRGVLWPALIFWHRVKNNARPKPYN